MTGSVPWIYFIWKFTNKMIQKGQATEIQECTFMAIALRNFSVALSWYDSQQSLDRKLSCFHHLMTGSVPWIYFIWKFTNKMIQKGQATEIQECTFMAIALRKFSVALSGSPKFNCALSRVTHAWEDHRQNKQENKFSILCVNSFLDFTRIALRIILSYAVHVALMNSILPHYMWLHFNKPRCSKGCPRFMSERKTKITCTVQEKKADGGNFSRRKKKFRTGGGNCQKIESKT
jgi:hypothetical protein